MLNLEARQPHIQVSTVSHPCDSALNFEEARQAWKSVVPRQI